MIVLFLAFLFPDFLKKCNFEFDLIEELLAKRFSLYFHIFLNPCKTEDLTKLMDLVAVLILLLSQGDQSLEVHMQRFLDGPLHALRQHQPLHVFLGRSKLTDHAPNQQPHPQRTTRQSPLLTQCLSPP